GSVFARLVGSAADAARLETAVAAALKEHGK
ncbi:MAG: F0F1 ATP synthase subunit B', partial [Magnetospirillum sp.]